MSVSIKLNVTSNVSSQKCCCVEVYSNALQLGLHSVNVVALC